MAVVSSQKHNVTIGKKNSWEIAYLCKVDDKVVGNNFRGLRRSARYFRDGG